MGTWSRGASCVKHSIHAQWCTLPLSSSCPGKCNLAILILMGLILYLLVRWYHMQDDLSDFFSSLALWPFKYGLDFPHDRCPVYSLQSSFFSVLSHPYSWSPIQHHLSPLTYAFLYFSFLLICLTVTSLLALYHLFLQHAQAIPVYVTSLISAAICYRHMVLIVELKLD